MSTPIPFTVGKPWDKTYRTIKTAQKNILIVERRGESLEGRGSQIKKDFAGEKSNFKKKIRNGTDVLEKMK
jgi:hypothetical protein